MVIILILFLIYGFRWETNDDVYMSSISYGVYGQYDEHLIYINIIMGRLIKLLLTVCPLIPWYGILQVLFVFSSFVIIVYRIFDIRLDCETVILCTIMLWNMGQQFYVQIQFTKTAGITSIAGILLILKFCGQKKNKNMLNLAIGVLMCVVGILYRADSFYLVFAMLFVLGVYELIFFSKYKNIKAIIRYGMCAMLLVVIALGTCTYNNLEYDKDVRYVEYEQFNKERTLLTDYYWPDYNSAESSYNEVGISSEDIDFYKTWNFSDMEIVNTNNLKVINLSKSNEEVKVSRSFKNFIAELYKTYSGYSYVIALFLILAIGIPKRRFCVFALFSIMSFMCLQLYLYYKGRVFINRVDAVFVMAQIVVLLTILVYESENFGIKMIGLIIIFLPIFILHSYTPQTTDFMSEMNTDEMQQWEEYLLNNRQSLFMMENWTNVMLWDSVYSIWNVPPKGLGCNVYVLGGWQYQSPNTNNILDVYGVDNPFTDMVDNKSVKFVMKGDVSGFENYLERHYYSNVEFKVVDKIGECSIYDIYESNGD